MLLLALLFAGRAEAQGTEAARVLTLINQARANAGLVPLAASAQLTAAAQAHANDMARNGVGIGHTGSDGSTPAARIVRAGYGTYSWGPLVGENWAALFTVDASVSAWLGDAPHRENILKPEYREIGIGVVSSTGGYPIVVADFGAQPNVLPVFVGGAGPTVNLTLANEDVAPEGDGPNRIGRAVLVAISTRADFTQARTIPFARSIQFTSADGRSTSNLYIRFYDAQGRTTVTAASASGGMMAPATLVASTPVAVPSRTLTRTPRPAPTRTRTPRPPTATATSTDEPSVCPSATPSVSPPTVTETLRVRQAIATSVPASVGVSTGDGQDIFSQFAAGLFAASGLILLLALGVVWRWWRSGQIRYE